jgi:hypothetical protein
MERERERSKSPQPRTSVGNEAEALAVPVSAVSAHSPDPPPVPAGRPSAMRASPQTLPNNLALPISPPAVGSSASVRFAPDPAPSLVPLPATSPAGSGTASNPSSHRGSQIVAGSSRRDSVNKHRSMSMGTNGVLMNWKKEMNTREMQAMVAPLPAAEVAEALLTSEGEYVLGLKLCLDVFCLRLRNHIILKRELLSEAEIKALFNNVANIKNLNSKLYEDMAELYAQGPQVLLEQLGKLMAKFVPFFKSYTEYIKNVRESLREFQSKCSSNKDLEFFVNLNEMSTGRHLVDLLMSPVNRVSQYLVYLGDVS